jgi:hypothetical protein
MKWQMAATATFLTSIWGAGVPSPPSMEPPPAGRGRGLGGAPAVPAPGVILRVSGPCRGRAGYLGWSWVTLLDTLFLTSPPIR